MFHFGDIVYVNLDPSLGHEQNKRRPVVVVGNDRFNSRCNLTFVTPITHANNGYPLHVNVGLIMGGENTLINGYAAVEQTKSLDLTVRDPQKVGVAPDSVMEEISDRLLSCLLRDDQSVLSSELLQ